MAKAFLDSDNSSDEDGGVALVNGTDFKINEDFANKFTYNKKREELRRLEEKHGKTTKKRKRGDGEPEDSDDSSTSEDEDDAGELVTEALDSEIFATLNAIRSKDPKVYDPKVNFYTPAEDGEAEDSKDTKKAKPMFLRDYHREVLLNGNGGTSQEEPLSYNQEQEVLKKSIVAEMHAAASGDSEDDMLVAKENPKRTAHSTAIELDVDSADKDPEEYLNKFMSARAWIPTERSRFQALESDDSDDDRRAEEFEEAYNLRFEDPAKSNEKLRTHDREIAAKYSVRREETNPRKKKRETEREKREREKQLLRDEKARLRKLRIEEVEEKVRRIKRAAGLKNEDIKPEDWANFVDEDWDDTQWEAEMQKRFGDDYYQAEDAASGEDAESKAESKKRKVKKPKFEDDIDIKDIIPDFVSEEDADFSMTDEEAGGRKTAKLSRDHKKEKEGRKKDAKKERRIIEQLVDNRLELDTALRSAPAKGNGFRYRDTSPTSFGLSMHEILMADDSQLNQFVGLKKLAAFRDPTKKQKDRKHLGKKARLRNWRKETFGDENGPRASELFASAKPVGDEAGEVSGAGEDGRADIVEGARKKKRRRHKKAQTAGEVASVE